MRNLDPKTTEQDIRKEVSKAVMPTSIKVNKHEHTKKKSISAHITFNNFRETKTAKDHFEKKPRHIKNRPVSVSLGKEATPSKPPMVISSDAA
jgi:RNA recognition motif-containing protein